mgnify:CR=1 FL=1
MGELGMRAMDEDGAGEKPVVAKAHGIPWSDTAKKAAAEAKASEKAKCDAELEAEWEGWDLGELMVEQDLRQQAVYDALDYERRANESATEATNGYARRLDRLARVKCEIRRRGIDDEAMALRIAACVRAAEETAKRRAQEAR